jgi:hypothetical protein
VKTSERANLRLVRRLLMRRWLSSKFWLSVTVLTFVTVPARDAKAGSITCVVVDGELTLIIATAPGEAHAAILKATCVDGASSSGSGSGRGQSGDWQFSDLAGSWSARSRNAGPWNTGSDVTSSNALLSTGGHATMFDLAVSRHSFEVSDGLFGTWAGVAEVGEAGGSPAARLKSNVVPDVAVSQTSAGGDPEGAISGSGLPAAALYAGPSVITITAFADHLIDIDINTDAGGREATQAAGSPFAGLAAVQVEAEVPEPASLVLLGIGLTAAAFRLGRKSIMRKG